MSPRPLRALVPVLLAACAAACRAPSNTALRLEVVSHLTAGNPDVSRVHVRTYDWSAPQPATTIGQADFRAGHDAPLFPFSMAIVPRDPSAPSTSVGIEVSVFGPGSDTTPLMVERVLTGFVPDSIRVVRVVLEQPCVRTPTTPTCGDDQTCDPTGACVTATPVDPTTLPLPGQPDDAAVAMDVPPAMDTPDVPVAPEDAPDVVDVPQMPDIVDVPVMPDVQMNTGPVCPPSGATTRCPDTRFMCVGPPPPSNCCLVMPGLSSCVGVTCPTGASCMVDPMGHAACCEPPS